MNFLIESIYTSSPQLKGASVSKADLQDNIGLVKDVKSYIKGDDASLEEDRNKPWVGGVMDAKSRVKEDDPTLA